MFCIAILTFEGTSHDVSHRTDGVFQALLSWKRSKTVICINFILLYLRLRCIWQTPKVLYDMLMLRSLSCSLPSERFYLFRWPLHGISGWEALAVAPWQLPAAGRGLGWAGRKGLPTVIKFRIIRRDLIPVWPFGSDWGEKYRKIMSFSPLFADLEEHIL